MHDSQVEEPAFRVDWAKLNNELFGRIYADGDLHARYERASADEAPLICSNVFDELAQDAAEFVQRFIIITH